MSYNEIGDEGAVAIARIFEEHDEMQSRLELWSAAKRKRIEISQQLTEQTHQVPVFSITSSESSAQSLDLATSGIFFTPVCS